MRFNPFDEKQKTAADIINNASELELIKILHLYGEEKLASEIAQALVIKRRKTPFSKTDQLTEVILEVYRSKLKTDKEIPWVGGLHPATKIFQALRMAVNTLSKNIGQVYPDTAGRMRVLLDSITGSLTLATITTVGTVTTATTLTNLGSFNSSETVPGIMHISADGLRRNISVT
jgi:hypothetical protein